MLFITSGIGFDSQHSCLSLIFLVGTLKAPLAEYSPMVAALSRFLHDPAAREALLAARKHGDFRARVACALPT